MARQSRRKVLWTGLMVSLGIGLCTGAAQNQNGAQSGDTTGSRTQVQITSELARANMERVAASAQEIKAVLVQDPGLMVQLKRWVAKDATDHGQMVTDADMEDGAIYDRLETDVTFRSVATLLVQHYGYLVPKVNPDSAIGKEQELLVQERAKWLAQADEEERAKQRTNQQQGLQQARQCDPERDANCESQSQQEQLPSQNPGQQGTPGLPPSRNNPGQPTGPNYSRPGGSLETAQLSQNQRENGNGYPGTLPGGSSYDESNALNGLGAGNAQALPRQTGNGANGGAGLGTSMGNGGDTDLQSAILGLSMDETGNSTMNGGMSMGGAGGEFGNPDLNFLGGSRTNGSEGFSGYANSPFSGRQPPYRRNQQNALLQPTLFRQPNPYEDIPSLYDMYLQAMPHPTSPRRFGEEIFENGTRDAQMLPMDLPVGPDYVVGPGDALAINLWGGVSQRLLRTVDGEGRVNLPEVGPVLVSGKSLADVQQNVQQILRTQFRDVSVDVSLARLRTIRIYEVGDVRNPGAYDISSLSTPLNALFVAGGPTQRGSLRIVKHYRGSELVQVVDLYDLLLNGVKTDIARLENGDTVLVPSAGPEVTIEGMVRRPAIYELKDEKTLADALQLAGGLLPAATLRHIEVQRIVAHEKQTMLSVDIPASDDDAEATKKLESFLVQDGDRIRIFPIAPYNQDVVYLEGHVIRPGRYSYRADMRVTDVVSSYKDLLPEPASQYAEIIRLNAPDFHPSVESFDLAQAFADPTKAPVLHPLDTVRIFSRFDFENPPSVAVLGDVRNPGTYRTSGQIRLADAVHLAGGLAPDAERQDAQVFRYLPGGQVKIFSVSLSGALEGDPAANIALEPRDRLLIHRSPDAADPASVYIKGEVGKPGRYPLTTNMTVADLIRVGGGLKPSADTQTGDLTRYEWPDGTKFVGKQEEVSIASALAGDAKSGVRLHNGDVLGIRQLTGWDDLGASITVRGEVRHPGTYGIRPGERLSSVLERAGGFQSDAYPYGAILQRTQVRELEYKQRDLLILRVKDEQNDLQLMPDTDPKEKRAKEMAMRQWRATLDELTANPPVGRVTIQIASNLNHWRNTNADITLRAGDTLTIPKRPSYVMVTGQVFNPTAVSYRPGKSGKWYLGESGGPTQMANRKDIFVIRADGSVVGSKKDLWSGSSLSAVLQPGDTLVVPERAIGGTGLPWETILEAGQMATSVASTLFIALRY